jgi:hypothetical protein
MFETVALVPVVVKSERVSAASSIRHAGRGLSERNQFAFRETLEGPKDRRLRSLSDQPENIPRLIGINGFKLQAAVQRDKLLNLELSVGRPGDGTSGSG